MILVILVLPYALQVHQPMLIHSLETARRFAQMVIIHIIKQEHAEPDVLTGGSLILIQRAV